VCCVRTKVIPNQIVEWFVMRWQVEVTFQEARRHLGVETQRQWSDKAIARITPLWLGLFSGITLVAHAFHFSRQPVVVRQMIWYTKALPTFFRCVGPGPLSAVVFPAGFFTHRGKKTRSE